MMLTLRPPMADQLRARGKALLMESMEVAASGKPAAAMALSYRGLAAMAMAGRNRKLARHYIGWARKMEKQA